MRKQFSRDHCCWGRSKPGCRIVGSHTTWELTTWWKHWRELLIKLHRAARQVPRCRNKWLLAAVYKPCLTSSSEAQQQLRMMTLSLSTRAMVQSLSRCFHCRQTELVLLQDRQTLRPRTAWSSSLTVYTWIKTAKFVQRNYVSQQRVLEKVKLVPYSISVLRLKRIPMQR